jgi:ring-1,2-phenylacetyl-CoA epoxidase subunit PaaB
VSIWVVESAKIAAFDPDTAEHNFAAPKSKVYRHPTFFEIPEDVGAM